jgi:uncharacterized protein with FMN-binding domain
MRRKQVVTLTILAVVIVIAYFGVATIKSYLKTIEANLEQLTTTPISDVDMSQVADGVYTGSYHAFPMTAEVRVTVKDHRISGIELAKHINGRGSQAEAITGRVVEAQTLTVDAVSGATYSSMVILRAIENALNSATEQR